MNKIAFVKSGMPYEDRVGILPHHLDNIKNPENIYIEKNYASHLGISDEEYLDKGANIESDKDSLLKMDVVVDPKIGSATYIDSIQDGTTVFGYFHAVQNKELTDQLLLKKLRCYAWEDMYDGNFHLFDFNNKLAGFASVMHASTLWGRLIKNKQFAVLGRGNTAIGAIDALSKLGAHIDVYGRNGEEDFKKRIEEYDGVINAVLWDVRRKDYLISKDDLSKMKINSLIIDISCDIDGAIETSSPRDLSNPFYKVDGIFHYSLSNTPSLYALDASNHFGEVITEFVNLLVDGESCDILNRSLIVDNGEVIDQRINKHQNR